MRYEERAKANKVNKILKECWEEIDRRAKVDMSKWKKMRCSYYEDLGVNLSEVTQRLKREERLSEELRNADRGIQKQEQYDRIVNSRYNKMYRTIRKEERAAYLKEDYNGRDQSMIARFRGGNEELGSRHWRPKDENKCRLCGQEVETLEHMIEECQEMGKEAITKFGIMKGGEDGTKWMRKVLKLRKKKEEGNKNGISNE